MKELIARLRDECGCNIDETPCWAESECRVMAEAAAALERAEALAEAVRLHIARGGSREELLHALSAYRDARHR